MFLATLVSFAPPSTYHASSCASWRKEGCPTPGPRTAHLQGAYSIRSFYPGSASTVWSFPISMGYKLPICVFSATARGHHDKAVVNHFQHFLTYGISATFSPEMASLPTLKTIACPWAGVASMETSDLVPSRVEASSSLSIFSSCWTLSLNSHSCSQLYHLHHFKQPPSSHLYCRPWPQGTRTIFVFKLNAWYIFFTFNFYTLKSVD